jgi:NADPH:quinone reductase-like Zn-dependent oxidoreductase
MKALVYREYGSPDRFRLEDVPTPTPGDGEVLVRVRASSVNDYDFHLLTGRPFLNRIGGVRRPKHLVLGSDVAGTVEAVGSGVTRWTPGDEVVGDVSPRGFGAFAQYVVAPQAMLSPKPPGLTFEQAATVPQAGSLAMTGIRGALPLRAGASVLVNGAGGGVGTLAVQIAKGLGAEVTGVDASRKLDVVRGIGADHVIDYEAEDFTENGRRYDLILDVASHRSVRAYRRSLNPGGVCSLIGGDIPRLMMVMATGPLMSRVRDTSVTVPLWRPNDPDEVASLSSMLEEGSVVPVIDSTYTLESVPDAFRRFAAQEHTGKIAISIA